MEVQIQSLSGRLGRLVSNRPCADVMVSRSEIFELENKRKPVQVICLDGLLWITQNDDPEDHFIHKGQTFTATQPGKVIIQGLPRGKARVSIH